MNQHREHWDTYPLCNMLFASTTRCSTGTMHPQRMHSTKTVLLAALCQQNVYQFQLLIRTSPWRAETVFTNSPLSAAFKLEEPFSFSFTQPLARSGHVGPSIEKSLAVNPSCLHGKGGGIVNCLLSGAIPFLRAELGIHG